MSQRASWIRGTAEMHESAALFHTDLSDLAGRSRSIADAIAANPYGPRQLWQAAGDRAAARVDRPMFRWRQVGAGTTRNEIVTAASFRT
jgi:hypothetical protein